MDLQMGRQTEPLMGHHWAQRTGQMTGPRWVPPMDFPTARWTGMLKGYPTVQQTGHCWVTQTGMQSERSLASYLVPLMVHLMEGNLARRTAHRSEMPMGYC